MEVLALMIQWSDKMCGIVVMELTSSSGKKMISKILSLRVGSLTCWLINSNPASSVNGLAIGQLMVGHDQSMVGYF